MGTAPEKLRQVRVAIRAEQESQGFQGDQQIQGKRQHKMTENRIPFVYSGVSLLKKSYNHSQNI